MPSLREVAARREELLRRSGELRARMALEAESLHHALGRVDGAIAAVRRTVFSPFGVAVGIALAAALRPRRLSAWAAGAWSAWRFLSPLIRAASGR